MAGDSPPLLRPQPRRPFQVSGLAPPDDNDSNPPSPNPDTEQHLLIPNRFDETPSLSRPASFRNLTSGALFGIFSQTFTGSGDRQDQDELGDTPWGTGAQTPIRRPTLDEETYQLMKERSHRPTHRRMSSYRSADSAAAAAMHTAAPAKTSRALSLAVSAAVLFLLGVGYGALVFKFHRGEDPYDMAFLAFWGVAGVVLGALLPWFDTVWEDTSAVEEDQGDDEAAEGSVEEGSSGTDWALVMRAIGAFVGIVFAIRKLAWSSTLQVSATLALVNPLLWWIIDRSQSGFFLSAAVGVTGSMVLLGVNPEMMPTPSTSSLLNHTAFGLHAQQQQQQSANGEANLLLGGWASHETVEAGVWMLSVLFCSCVCFGNIGRRLAPGAAGGAKGRWGGLR